MRLKLFLLLLGISIFSGFAKNPVDQPIYNKISDENLVKIIKEFILKGCQNKENAESKFINLYLYRVDSSRNVKYRIILNFSPNSEHEYIAEYGEMIIVCSPICGKKILVHLKPKIAFIGVNLPDAAEYFRNDLPDQYENLKEFIETKKNTPNIHQGGLLYNPTFELMVNLDENFNFIDSMYLVNNPKKIDKIDAIRSKIQTSK